MTESSNTPTTPKPTQKPSATYGGLELDFIDEIPDELLCGICTKVSS